jgi:hypothetical protein
VHTAEAPCPGRNCSQRAPRARAVHMDSSFTFERMQKQAWHATTGGAGKAARLTSRFLVSFRAGLRRSCWQSSRRCLRGQSREWRGPQDSRYKNRRGIDYRRSGLANGRASCFGTPQRRLHRIGVQAQGLFGGLPEHTTTQLWLPGARPSMRVECAVVGLQCGVWRCTHAKLQTRQLE